MLKWVAAAVAAILVLVIAAAVAIPYVVDTPRVQALISHTVTQALGRPVKFASVSVSVFPLPAVKLKDLQIAEDPRFGARPFLRVATGSFRLRVWPLLSGRVEFRELVLENPQVILIQDRGGRMNISSLGPVPGGATGGHASPGRAGGAAGGVPVVSRIRIVDGLLL
ncbi:MAG: AsmA family protein, partial [Candidatus Rokubacteria bacterium]|nr:AsmA family protein [Candidatus Rokubacteria bacterium]